MAIRYSKMHTTPLPVEIDFIEATDLGLDIAIEIGWTRRPLGVDPASAVTAHIEWLSKADPPSFGSATAFATSYGYRIDATAPADYFLRVRLQNSNGYSEWSPRVEVANP